MNAVEARRIFDCNAETYDQVNSVASLGFDRVWHRWAAARALVVPGALVLDAMSGTGGVAIEAARRGADVVAADVSPRMLLAARAHACEHCVAIRTVVADMTDPLALPLGPFDAVTLAFGLRFAEDQPGLIRSLARRVRPGGPLVLIEACVPHRGTLSVRRRYLMNVVPRIGIALGGDREAYLRLREWARYVGDEADLEQTVRDSGLTIAEKRSFAFGLVTGMVLV